MNKIIHSINLWRLKRMMIKAARFDDKADAMLHKIDKLGAKLDKWERENINISTQ